MSDVTSTFDTGYIGAHRWHVDERKGYDWTCVCGDKGRVVSTGDPAHRLSFLYEAFGQHAHQKLLDAAVEVILRPLPHNRSVYLRLETQARDAQKAGKTDEGNLLMSAANGRYHESQEHLAGVYKGLQWHGWPDLTVTPEGLATEVTEWNDQYSYWLHVHPGPRGWAWEAWLTDPEGNSDTRLGLGSSPTQEDAKVSAWEAVVLHLHHEEDKEPF